MSSRTPIRWRVLPFLMALLLGAGLQGCGGDTVGPESSVAGGGGSGGGSTGGSGGGSTGGSIAPLTMYEEEVLGAWSRYHAYDGSTQYFVFNGNRTGCKWEETSTGSVKSTSSYSHWELRAASGSNVFELWVVTGSGELWDTGTVYRFNEDVVLLGGYSNLDMGRDSSVSGCP